MAYLSSSRKIQQGNTDAELYSQGSLGWPQAYGDLLVFASQVLQLKAYATMSSKIITLTLIYFVGFVKKLAGLQGDLNTNTNKEKAFLCQA